MTLLALARWPQESQRKALILGLRFGLPLLCLTTAFILWGRAERPAVLISASGDAVGVMTPSGRAVSKPKGGSFAIENWLESDGDGMAQQDAALRPLWSGPMTERSAWLALGDNRLKIIHLTGKNSADEFERHCQRDTLIVTDQRLDLRARIWPCLVFDTGHLTRTGTVALLPQDVRPKIVTVAEVTGRRPWAGHQSPPRGHPPQTHKMSPQTPIGR